jgi:large subunit ribosomal protein L13
MIEKYSNEMVYEAIKGMVPKTRLGRQVLTKLTCYKNEGKDHSAQQPIEL